MREQVPSGPVLVGRRLQIAVLSVLAIASVGAASVWLVAFRKAADVGAKAPTPVAAAKPSAAPVRAVAGRAPAEDNAFIAVEAGASRMQGDPATALQRYQDAVAKDGNDADALNGLGEALMAAGRAGEAVAYFDRALAVRADEVGFVLHRAKANAVLNKWSECAEDYRRAQELLPNDGAIAFNLAVVMRRSGDSEHVAAQLERAVQLAPQDARVRREFAVALERLHRRAEAAAAYKEYLWLAPDAPDADKVKAKISDLSAAGSAPGTPGEAGKI